jgi:hypothetical protein
MRFNAERQAGIARKNAMTRARKHLRNDRPQAALKCLDKGDATAESWRDGTHPKLRR